MEEIKNALAELLGENEEVASFSVVGSYRPYYFIREIGSDDVGNALEDTLRRCLEADLDPYVIMGAYIPTEEEWEEINRREKYTRLDYRYEGYEGYTSLDLGYIVGLIQGVDVE